MVTFSDKKTTIIILSSQYCIIVKTAKIHVLLQLQRKNSLIIMKFCYKLINVILIFNLLHTFNNLISVD